MFIHNKAIVLVCLAAAGSLDAANMVKKGHTGGPADVENTGTKAVLWRDPSNLASRDLFYGPGGKRHEPHGPFKFVKEDLDGTNPKFYVRDGSGVEWKVKLGSEARPETAATRLVWAAGYFANEVYFVPELRVENLPERLHRGEKLIWPGGVFHDVSLERKDKMETKKIGTWRWRRNPFSQTVQFNGLRVLMAVINNWDLKDQNNAVYQDAAGERIYMVSDLGASFGTPGLDRTRETSKGNLDAFRSSRFIKRIAPDRVDFESPRRAVVLSAANPHEFISRLSLRWIGRNIPRADARWTGQLLARLSPRQIREAFRAAGYSPEDAGAFAEIIEERIAQLTDL